LLKIKEDIVKWLQHQQKQRCANLKNLQRGTGIDAACAEDREAITEISGFAEYVCANWRITAKFPELQNQAGKIKKEVVE
jgi:hypothetical protein